MADPAGLTPEMSPAERDFLARCLSNTRSLVEFGSGGSTLLAVRTPVVQRIWSVESDPAWIAKLRQHPEIAGAERSGRLCLLHADIGPTGDHGVPIDGARQADWPAYYEAVWADPATAGVGLCFIDGRFRVACALEALARCGNGTALLLHDFWNRPAYHPVLAFTDWLGSCGTLALLRRKPAIDREHFEKVRQAHRLQVA